MNPEQCILPACRNEATEPGMPCTDCEAAFGSMLRVSDVPQRPTVVILAEFAERDAATRTALARQVAIVSGKEYRMPNQICWMCERRRTCTKTPSGMECDECKEVTG